MSLNLNTNGITNYAGGHSPTTNVVHNNKYYTNFKANNQDSFERSNINPKHKTSKMNVALGTILSVGLLIGADFAFNHGKASRSLWNKIHPTEQVSKSYVDNIEQVQQHFSQIFGKNFSKDEANELAKKYKELMREDDINILSDKLFNELKQDYGLHGIELRKAGHINLGRGMQGGAMLEQTGTKVTVYLDCINDTTATNLTPKESLFSKLSHELCHARQDRILYRADKERLAQIIAQRSPNELTSDCWDEILRRNGGNPEQAVNSIKEQLKHTFEQKYGNVDSLPQKTSEEVEALFNNKLYYKKAGTVPHAEYIEQPIEKEAYTIDDIALKLLKALGVK